jgi:hypothetical protein
MSKLVNGQVVYEGGEAVPVAGSADYLANQQGKLTSTVAPAPVTPAPGVPAMTPTDLGKAIPLTIPVVAPGTGAEGMTGAATTILETSKTLNAEQKVKEEAAQKAKNDARTKLDDLQAKITGVRSQRAGVEEEFGVAKKTTNYNNVTTQLEASQRAQTNELRALETASGMTTAGKEAAIREVNRKYAFEQADLSLIQTAANRDMLTASALADRKVKLMLEPLEEEMKFVEMFYEENKENLSEEQQRAFELKLTEDKRNYEEIKSKEENLQKIKLEMLTNASEADASPAILSAIQKAKTPEEAITAAGVYGADQLRRLQVQKARADLDKAGDADKLLTVNEAKTLGVPYGTTRGEASAMAKVPGAVSEAGALKITALDSARALMEKFKKPGAPVGAASIGFNLPGSERRNFIIQFDNLKSLMSLDAVKYLKGQGAVSEAERALLANAASRLDRAQSKPEFEKALGDMITALSGETGSMVSEEDQLRAQGYTDEQIEQIKNSK